MGATAGRTVYLLGGNVPFRDLDWILSMPVANGMLYGRGVSLVGVSGQHTTGGSSALACLLALACAPVKQYVGT